MNFQEWYDKQNIEINYPTSKLTWDACKNQIIKFLEEDMNNYCDSGKNVKIKIIEKIKKEI